MGLSFGATSVASHVGPFPYCFLVPNACGAELVPLLEEGLESSRRSLNLGLGDRTRDANIERKLI